MSDPSREIRIELGVLTDQEFCLAVGIEQSTAATWRCRGTGPDFVKVGARILYRLVDISEWLEANRRLCNRTDREER
jgi:hypothetical protein